jgi:hypothetical protein
MSTYWIQLNAATSPPVTDELPAYSNAIEIAGHATEKQKTVNHSAKVYVDGDITTNGI